MINFIDKIFKSSNSTQENEIDAIGQFLEEFILKSKLDLSFDVEEKSENVIFVNFFGEDEEVLTRKNGMLLNALTTLTLSVMYRLKLEKKIRIEMDANGFREAADRSLEKLALKLAKDALKNGRPTYLNPLPPRERKVVHECLSEVDGVKTISIGDSYIKKIKIVLNNEDGDSPE